LQEQLVSSLHQLFNVNRGDNPITFEVMELNKITKQVAVQSTAPLKEVSDDENDENYDEEVNEPVMTDVEDIQVVTKLVMPSRKMKVKISTDLLHELDRLQVNFKLN